MEETALLHYPAPPVYERLPSVDGIVHIRAPDKPKRLSRRDRALLVVALKQSEVNLRDWSAADLARLFGASPRSVSEASKLSPQERQDIADGQRPLFLHQPASSAPITPAVPNICSISSCEVI
jgi:hypothetical protein